MTTKQKHDWLPTAQWSEILFTEAPGTDSTGPRISFTLEMGDAFDPLDVIGHGFRAYSAQGSIGGIVLQAQAAGDLYEVRCRLNEDLITTLN